MVVDPTTDGYTLTWNDPLLTDKNGKTAPSQSSGFVRIILFFDYMDASEDVISASTDMGSTKEEGDQVAKLEVVLNNHDDQYARRLIPLTTTVMSWIHVQRNVVEGEKLTIVNELFPFFFGLVNEVNLNGDTATVSCGDEMSKGNACGEADLTWFGGEKDVKGRVEDILSVAGPEIDVLVQKYVKQTEAYASTQAYTNESTSQNISNTVRLTRFEWAVPADQVGRLLIIDKDYQAGTTEEDLTEFVTDPGDNESIVGHCNDVTVVGDSIMPEDSPAWAVLASDSTLTYTLDYNNKSVDTHGYIPSINHRIPNFNSENIDILKRNILDVYDSYKDRLITPTVASKIPLLFSHIRYDYMFYDIPEIEPGTPELSIGHDNVNYNEYHERSMQLSTKWKNVTLRVSVRRKKTTYDGSVGVLTTLECRRLEEEITSGGKKLPDKFKRAAFSGGTMLGEPTHHLLAYDPDDGRVYAMYFQSVDEMNDFINNGRTPDNSKYENWSKHYMGWTPWGYVYDGKIAPDKAPSPTPPEGYSWILPHGGGSA